MLQPYLGVLLRHPAHLEREGRQAKVSIDDPQREEVSNDAEYQYMTTHSFGWFESSSCFWSIFVHVLFQLRALVLERTNLSVDVRLTILSNGDEREEMETKKLQIRAEIKIQNLTLKDEENDQSYIVRLQSSLETLSLHRDTANFSSSSLDFFLQSIDPMLAFTVRLRERERKKQVRRSSNRCENDRLWLDSTYFNWAEVSLVKRDAPLCSVRVLVEVDWSFPMTMRLSLV